MILPDLSGALIKTPTKNNILVLAKLQSPTSALNLKLESRLRVFYITTTRLINVMDAVVNTHVFSGWELLGAAGNWIPFHFPSGSIVAVKDLFSIFLLHMHGSLKKVHCVVNVH